MIDERILREWALELGFCEAALCSAEEFADERKLVSAQEPLAERRQLRFSPQDDDERIKSLCVLLWPYSEVKQVQGDSVFVDSYYFASNAAYHAARTLEERMIGEGHFAKANVSYPAKRAAIRAGMGVIGRNGLLITPQYGTRVVIILMATDIPLQGGTDHSSDKQDACLQCGRCSSFCPSGALGTCGMEKPEKCLRNFTMEGSIVPIETRKQIGIRLIGCDMCQRVCPMQPHDSKETGIEESPVFSLDEFMTLDSVRFSKSVSRLAAQIGRNAARPQRVRAQAALIAGNIKKREYLPVLLQWAQSDFEAVRTHALWAIDQIEGNRDELPTGRT